MTGGGWGDFDYMPGWVSLDLDLMLGEAGVDRFMRNLMALDQTPDGPVTLGWRGRYYLLMQLTDPQAGDGALVAITKAVEPGEVDPRGLIHLDEAA